MPKGRARAASARALADCPADALWSDLAHESAPVGEECARRVWNVFGGHPDFAIREDRSAVVTPARGATEAESPVAGEPILGQRPGARDVHVRRPRDGVYPGIPCAGEDVGPDDREGDHSRTGVADPDRGEEDILIVDRHVALAHNGRRGRLDREPGDAHSGWTVKGLDHGVHAGPEQA